MAPTEEVTAKPAATLTDYPLSCSAAARPLVFKGWEAMHNARIDQARELFAQAVATDPGCVVARAHQGALTRNDDGMKMFDEALTQLASLTEVERLHLRAADAKRKGDPEKALSFAQRMRELAPSVFQVQLAVASYASALNRWNEMGEAARKATELNADSGAGWNLLGYSRLALEQHDDAVAAFRKYVQVAPTEPNAHDSLADALLADQMLEEAASEYQRALNVSGGAFWLAWEGLATVKAIKGDFEGARAALASMKAVAVQPADKLDVDRMVAWTWVAQGKLPNALKVMAGSEKEATDAKLGFYVARLPLYRGSLQFAAQRYTEALKSFQEARRVKLDTLPEGQARVHRLLTLASLVGTHARLGRAADAERHLAALGDFINPQTVNPFESDLLAYSRGLLALAKKDTRGAIDAMEKCTDEFDYCHLALAEAQELAGDAAGATQTRSRVLKANHRDPMYWAARVEAAARIRRVSAPGSMP